MIQLFPYMAVVDDLEFYPAAAWARSALRAHAKDALVARLLQDVRDLYEVDLADELVAKKHVLDPILSRHIQMFLAIALGRIAERTLGRPSGHAGYCAGMMPALVLGKGLDLPAMMALVPALNAYMRDMVASFLRRGIHAATLDFSRVGWNDRRIGEVVRACTACGLYIKDQRSAATWEIIGEREPLLAWIDEIQGLAGSRLRLDGPRRDTIAHTPLANRAPFVEALEGVCVQPVSGPVVVSSGVTIMSEDTSAFVKSTMTRTMFDPIKSAHYLSTIVAMNEDVVFFGSEQLLRFMLEGTGVATDRFRIFAPDNATAEFQRVC